MAHTPKVLIMPQRLLSDAVAKKDDAGVAKQHWLEAFLTKTRHTTGPNKQPE